MHDNQTIKNRKQGKNLESGKRKATHHIQGGSNKTISWSLSRNVTSQKEWDDIFKILKGKKMPIKNITSKNLSFKNGEINTFPDKWKMEIIIARSSLEEMQNGVLQVEMKEC